MGDFGDPSDMLLGLAGSWQWLLVVIRSEASAERHELQIPATRQGHSLCRTGVNRQFRREV